MKTVCVFTPTYNRAYVLDRLYESLKGQTLQDFVWLVIDDGSVDDTSRLVQSYIDERCFPIIYKRVENGGKQRAHDYATSICENELFFCVDSDDYLLPDAIETVVSVWETAKEDTSVGGILALMGSDPEHPLGTWMPRGVEVGRQIDLYEKYGFRGDISLIYRTEILKQYRFDVEPGEKFIPETYVYYRIDERYLCKFVNKVLQIAEYLPDGYSKNFPANVLQSPRSYLKHKTYCMDVASGCKNLFYATVMYMVASHICDGNYGLERARRRSFAYLGLPLAFLLTHTKFRKR